MSAADVQLASLWLAAVARPEVSGAIEDVYAQAAAAIANRGPACWASGRCCNFRAAGHRLYVTGLEAAYTIARLPDVAGVRNENYPHARLDRAALQRAVSGGGCVFQVMNLCGVHGIKPLGCRVYFCDRSAQAWQEELSERLLGEIRGIHDRFGVDYRYGEWGEMLGRFV